MVPRKQEHKAKAKWVAKEDVVQGVFPEEVAQGLNFDIVM